MYCISFKLCFMKKNIRKMYYLYQKNIQNKFFLFIF